MRIERCAGPGDHRAAPAVAPGSTASSPRNTTGESGRSLALRSQAGRWQFVREEVPCPACHDDKLAAHDEPERGQRFSLGPGMAFRPNPAKPWDSRRLRRDDVEFQGHP